jgi:hypothetical protein
VEPVFALPASVVVSVAPYASLDAALADEASVDWNDATRARAITLAFAAREIRDHLIQAGIDAPLEAQPRQGSSAILVLTRDQLPALAASGIEVPPLPPSAGDEAFVIATRRNNLYIIGESRAGALHGVYRWLESLGYAWDDPYETFVPDRATLLARREWPRIESAPAIGLRGYWVYGRALPDSFALWMARNRFNVSAPVQSPGVQRKLSLKGWAGEHNLLQEEFSRPGLFEEHPDWFALIGGIRRPVEPTGIYFNPAFGNDAAADYFAGRMIERLRNGDLANVDVLNVWPTDDRFNRFDQSPAALEIGNETDNLLKFYGILARRLREAHDAGTLPRRVTLAGISYYLTMTPPTNPQGVAALDGADYLHLFYPITRSWNGPFGASLDGSEANRRIAEDLAAWRQVAPLRFGMVEYHNQSIYGAVALTDHLHLAGSHGFLTADSNALYAYMHPLDRNPGPRRLTNYLQSRLAWRETTGPRALERAALSDALTQEYFTRRYGALASDLRRVYELMAQSTENAQEMFGSNSLHMVLFQDLIWSPAFYPESEMVAAIPQYRAGGAQTLPAAFAGRTVEQANFRGLDSSLALQAEALQIWTRARETAAPAVSARLEADIAWFTSTASRYRLLAATCDYMVARHAGGDFAPARERMAAEIALLEGLAANGETISPVNQYQFLELHRTRAGL